MKKLFVGILMICFVFGSFGIIFAEDCIHKKDLCGEEWKKWSKCVREKCKPRREQCSEDCIQNLTGAASTRCDKRCMKEYRDCHCDCYRYRSGCSDSHGSSSGSNPYTINPYSNESNPYGNPYTFTPPPPVYVPPPKPRKRRVYKTRAERNEARRAAQYRRQGEAYRRRNGLYTGPASCFIDTLQEVTQ